MNLDTAGKDIRHAQWMWEAGDNSVCLQYVGFAIEQLESAKSKLMKI